MIVQDYTAACVWIKIFSTFFIFSVSFHTPLVVVVQALACSDGKTDLLRRETAACLQASEGASLIVFNLFTLEGYFVAQHLGVPCLAASPFIQTR